MYETQERAKRITDIHVLWGQSTVIEELIQAGKIDEEYIYPFNGDEVLEWWLVTPYMAELLKEKGAGSDSISRAISGASHSNRISRKSRSLRSSMSS